MRCRSRSGSGASPDETTRQHGWKRKRRHTNSAWHWKACITKQARQGQSQHRVMRGACMKRGNASAPSPSPSRVTVPMCTRHKAVTAYLGIIGKARLWKHDTPQPHIRPQKGAKVDRCIELRAGWIALPLPTGFSTWTPLVQELHARLTLRLPVRPAGPLKKPEARAGIASTKAEIGIDSRSLRSKWKSLWRAPRETTTA